MKLITRTSLTILIFTSVLVVQPHSAQAQLEFLFRNPLLGKKAPDFTLKTINVPKLNMTRYRNGQKAVIFFWATWCPHCQIGLQEISAQKKTLEKQGIKMILIDLGEDERQVRFFAQKKNIDFNIFLDETEAVGEAYKIIGVPTFFFLNEDGVVTAVTHSFPEDYLEFF